MEIGLALSGGGIRGIAHAGVLKALDENNIKVKAIGGTSAGSIVATLYAMGYKPYYIYVLFKKYAQEIINISNASLLNGLGNLIKSKKVGFSGLNDGIMLEKMFNEIALRKRIRLIEDIKKPLVISTVDIAEAKEYVITNCAPRDNLKDNYITEIEVGKAVRASSSFPAFFCPCEFKNHIFMDGGVLDNTPVLPLKQICDKKIIAVNFESDSVGEDCDVMDVIMKSLDIMGNKISEKSFEQSDLILTIPTDGAGLFDIDKLDKCYQFGYNTVMRNLKKFRDLL
ncbi:predicted esterase of the alpha-beta hydrolase superfamily [Clostridium sp. CAG:356]|nr:predicted esterase of the alpha-beta hydrolase superfamily [Clostridium sp. CAG:356]